MHRIALHRLELTWSLSEGTICVKACQFLGCKSKTTEPTHGAPKAVCPGVLTALNPKPRGAQQQSNPMAPAGAVLPPSWSVLFPACWCYMTESVSWRLSHHTRPLVLYSISDSDSSPIQACLARPLLPTEQSTASCKHRSASSAILTAARASLEFLGLILFSTSCHITQQHKFSLQTWSRISPSTRKEHFKNQPWPGFGLFPSQYCH